MIDANSTTVTADRTVTLTVPGATVAGSPDTASPFSFTVNGSNAYDSVYANVLAPAWRP